MPASRISAFVTSVASYRVEAFFLAALGFTLATESHDGRRAAVVHPGPVVVAAHPRVHPAPALARTPDPVRRVVVSSPARERVRIATPDRRVVVSPSSGEGFRVVVPDRRVVVSSSSGERVRVVTPTKVVVTSGEAAVAGCALAVAAPADAGAPAGTRCLVKRVDAPAGSSTLSYVIGRS